MSKSGFDPMRRQRQARAAVRSASEQVETSPHVVGVTLPHSQAAEGALSRFADEHPETLVVLRFTGVTHSAWWASQLAKRENVLMFHDLHADSREVLETPGKPAEARAVEVVTQLADSIQETAERELNRQLGPAELRNAVWNVGGDLGWTNPFLAAFVAQATEHHLDHGDQLDAFHQQTLVIDAALGGIHSGWLLRD